MVIYELRCKGTNLSIRCESSEVQLAFLEAVINNPSLAQGLETRIIDVVHPDQPDLAERKSKYGYPNYR